mmetsp:Transcript_106881/g.297633  ORF Transcript_106881/g.297633 Transcript_106881/m.297633 type:complete len:471 (+) Transcript_106881:10-1422(+)
MAGSWGMRSLFPPPSHEQPRNTESEAAPIAELELAEVEVTAEPVMAFFHIRVSTLEGATWTVVKRYTEILEFFDAIRPVTDFAPLPWNLDEVSLAQNESVHSAVQDQLDALLPLPAATSHERFLDFFRVSKEYQRRIVCRVPSLGSRTPKLAQRAERLVDDFYRELGQAYAEEQLATGQSSPTRSSTCRGLEAYQSEERCRRMRALSLQHLKRHPEWLASSSKLSDAQLRDLVAMQHYIDRDLEDLQLPEAKRFYRDTFSNGCISRQLLLDATRSCYQVDGRNFNWRTLFEEHGRPADEEEILKNCFVDALVASIQDSLGRGVAPPPLLVCAITSTMSQAGIASLDMACGPPHLAVSGGEHKVHFSLQARADGAWDVMLSTQQAGFESFIVCDAKDGRHGDSSSRSCSPRSTILKRCTVRFTVPIGDSTVVADVLRLHREVTVVNGWGQPLLDEVGCGASCLACLRAVAR